MFTKSFSCSKGKATLCDKTAGFAFNASGKHEKIQDTYMTKSWIFEITAKMLNNCKNNKTPKVIGLYIIKHNSSTLF